MNFFKRHRRLFFRVSLGLLPLYGLIAYLFLPWFWKEYERLPNMAASPEVTRTAQGIPGDPLNVALLGEKSRLIQAMEIAGWKPAQKLGPDSLLQMGESLLRRRPDPQAPVSSLYLFGRREDLAFEREAGPTLSRRHHVRFWRADALGSGDRPFWIGAASLDRSVGFSHYTGQVLHHIDPDLDAERGFLFQSLLQAGQLQEVYWVSGIGPTLNGRNGEGDWYFSDGEVEVGVLKDLASQRTTASTQASLLQPPARFRRSLWGALRGLLRVFDIF